ncbi:hypothetical protein ACNI65_23000 [Roseateles sp. So40a]|uniref:hypothetical protein n=1 Tax=Roseateles sp. So40a TaxID=3400226 RepID=UPI003A85956D
MSLHVLPAGTDVAEMAFFDTDDLPMPTTVDREVIEALEAAQRLISLPTGSDGSYLLHLYVDETIPANIQRYCATSDAKAGVFVAVRGHVAFGGLESAHAAFESNPNVRSDATIPAGRYDYRAFRTDFPEAVVRAAMKVERTAAERWISRAPSFALLTAAGLAIAMLAWPSPLAALLVMLAGVVLAIWLWRSPLASELRTRREEAQLDFPNVVLTLQSTPPGPRAAVASTMPG